MVYIGDFRLDIFDTYNFLIIAPFGFLSSLVLIFAQLTNTQLLRQPGDLIFMVSISELFLSVYYFTSGLRTKYITSTYKESSPFCRFNSYVGNIFLSLEFMYAVSMMLHIFFTMKSAVQKSFVPKKLYHVINLSVTFIINYIYINNSLLGKTPYGLCAITVGQMSSKGEVRGVFKGIWVNTLAICVGVSLGVFVLIYTSRNLPNFGRELNELKRDFMNYYKGYIKACIIIWVVIFLSQVAQVVGEDQTRVVEENQNIYGVIFNIGRVGNTAKVIMPLILFFIRIQDPMIRKNIWTPFSKLAKRMKAVEEKERIGRSTTILARKTMNENSITEPFDISVTTAGSEQNMAEMVDEAEDMDDLMWMNLLPNKIKESYTRTFLACISSKYPSKLEEKIGVVCETKADTEDVILYDIKGSSMMRRLKTDKSIIDCRFSIYCPAAFREIIESTFKKIDIKKALDVHLNEEKIKKAGESGGGASGELFMFSHDNQMILKTANHGEIEVFKNILLDYKEHLKNNKKSQISKIFGLFDFTFTGSDKSIKLILMENLFTLKNESILRKYDMKGSKHSRQVMKNYKELTKDKRVEKIMKDLDFVQIDKQMDVHTHVYNELMLNVQSDVEFFRSHAIIDYSIILAVVDVSLVGNEFIEAEVGVNPHILQSSTDDNVMYVFGIIDYFQLYDCQKSLERFFKKVMKCSPNLDTSSQPPKYYAERFNKWTKIILNSPSS